MSRPPRHSGSNWALARADDEAQLADDVGRTVIAQLEPGAAQLGGSPPPAAELRARDLPVPGRRQRIRGAPGDGPNELCVRWWRGAARRHQLGGLERPRLPRAERDCDGATRERRD